MLRCFSATFLMAGVLLTALPTAARSADKKSAAMKFVKKGIAFLGGAKNLKKFKGATFSEKGTYYGMGDGLPYTGKYAIQFPDKFRMEIVGVFMQVLNGDQGWVKMGDTVTAMNKDQIKALLEQHYVGTVSQLHPLLNTKKYTLTLIDDGKVGDLPVAFIKVASKGHTDVTLALNAKTGALVKAEYKAPMEGMPKKIVKYEAFYSDYKSAGKIKYPSKMRMTRAGEKYVEATLTEYKPVEKLDPETFAKPK